MVRQVGWSEWWGVGIEGDEGGEGGEGARWCSRVLEWGDEQGEVNLNNLTHRRAGSSARSWAMRVMASEPACGTTSLRFFPLP